MHIIAPRALHFFLFPVTVFIAAVGVGFRVGLPHFVRFFELLFLYHLQVTIILELGKTLVLDTTKLSGCSRSTWITQLS